MKRLTAKHYGEESGYYMKCSETCREVCCEVCEHDAEPVDKLGKIEDILSDDYDLDRLRELVEADKAGRCVVLPVKPGDTVRFAKNPRAKREKVACVTLYEDGKINLGFHDVGYKETWVDERSEDDAEKYVLAESEANHE